MHVYDKRRFFVLLVLVAVIAGGLLAIRFGYVPEIGRFFAAEQEELDIPRLKSIFPDLLGNPTTGGWVSAPEVNSRSVLVDANADGVLIPIAWKNWEPVRKQAPCAESEFMYDGYCYVVDTVLDPEIRDWSELGLRVTGGLVLVPDWAKRDDCVLEATADPTSGAFCAPANTAMADLRRFMAMIANRYSGGIMEHFLIFNEVNGSTWYNTGCRTGQPCDTEAWIQSYADAFGASYDGIRSQQPNARVYVVMDYGFEANPWDDPTGASSQVLHPHIAVTTFLKRFAAVMERSGNRQWRLAYHPYPPVLAYPQFSVNDLQNQQVRGTVGFGNIGILLGWLHQNFPGSALASEVMLTESGISSHPSYSSQELQAEWLCKSYRNILGTPGITDHYYHRLLDNSVESDAGLSSGLFDINGRPKQAFENWATMNTPGSYDCGFENGPYTVLSRWYSPTIGHWASSRLPPDGMTLEDSWKLFRDEQPGTVMLYECRVGSHNVLTTDQSCGGLPPLGPVGYAYASQREGTVPLRRCLVGEAADHFITDADTCSGYIDEGVLGYAISTDSVEVSPSETVTIVPGSDRAPIGFFDAAPCRGVASGWATDPDSETPVTVRFFDGPAQDNWTNLLGEVIATVQRGDPVGAHGFEWQVPESLANGVEHRIFAYAYSNETPTVFYQLPFGDTNEPPPAFSCSWSTPVTPEPEVSATAEPGGGDDGDNGGGGGGGGGTGTETETSKPGDVDGNQRVDIFDYNTVVSNFGKSGSGVDGDLDDNGKVDIFDYNEVVSNFNK